jgi:rhomboid protease GluP
MLGISCFMDGPGALKSITSRTALALGGMYEPLLKQGEIWRVFTYAFIHVSLIHFAVNMYSLFIIGKQMETFIGKFKFTAVFIVSAISGGLFSAVMGGEKILSIGASGAIFGLLGALLYFGYHYRAYLGQTLKSQVLPVLLINLAIGFIVPGIDNSCHIGGLVGGFLTMMALGVDGKSKTYEKINGMLCLLFYFAFVIYFIFFK